MDKMAEKKVRVLLGTRKGAYVVESDSKRKSWRVGQVESPGREVFHVTSDPRHPGHLYAAINDWMFGPIVKRSTNWGKTWEEITTPLMPATQERKPEFDTSGGEVQRPKHAITNLWHFEPGHADEPETLFLGVDPHMLFRSDDLGKSWVAVDSINNHSTKTDWGPGAGGPCMHTILIDPKDRRRMYVGMSAAGTFRSENGGKSWTAANKGVETPFLPHKYPEVGQCVHHVVLDPANPDTAYRQDHGGMYVSHDRMANWERIGKSIPTFKQFEDDFGFAVASAPALPGRAFFVPLEGRSRVTVQGGLQVFEWNDTKRSWRALMTPTKIPGNYGVHREGMNTDALDPAGIYVGTTTGQLVLSPDAGKSWSQVPFQFPGIHSVHVVSPS
ncbi:MAG: exo-alpha-sialidase [Euryarchaeota archaeon]|nr:exo-alpha-sialidase [Euryarchaeota archaeon]MDE1881308.1 exo-alpha-sialidase [Euryarchaeota archaeon]